MKTVFLSLVVFFIAVSGNSQNLLSPIWKYQNLSHLTEANNLGNDSWQPVNILLSWERQGYSGIDGACILRNEFTVNKDVGNLQLEFSFAAEVKAVYINQVQVIGKVHNSFWGERGKKTKVDVPESLLLKSAKNEIKILFNYLSYTGGISHNFCSLHPKEFNYENSIEIQFPTENHVYLKTDKRQFVINSDNISENNLQIVIKNDFHDTIFNESVNLKSGKQEYLFDFTNENMKPGFYECTVISESNYFIGTAAWFVIEPEEVKCSVKKFEGFDDYWKKAYEDLIKIDPKYKITKVDSLCSDTRNGYVVEMTSLGNLTIRGYYFVPKTNGKHPVILHVPGYTYGYEHLDGFINNKSNFAELALCVRGHGISKDVFNPWDTMTLWAVGICNKDEYVYRAMYMDCVRAVEFLLGRPEIDIKKIGVEGGSQGGGLALATAGLCHSHIAACAIFDPWMCDFRDQAAIRTVINKELDSFANYNANRCSREHMFSVLDFIDTKYFTSNIKCPVYFSTSLFDDDCPSHCGFAVYNNLKTEKTYKVYPNDSHLGESGQYGELTQALEKMLMEE